MALDGTYAGLKSTIPLWLQRDDLDDLVPDFIALAEVRLNDRLRLASMETEVTITLAAGGSSVLTDEETGDILISESTGDQLVDEVSSTAGGLPSDFLEARLVQANTSVPGTVLRLVSPARAKELYGTLVGYPDVYTITGLILRVYPSTDATVDLIYYARIPALSEDNPSNWLLTKYPQIYLYASLLEAAPLTRDDDRTIMWNMALDKAIADAQESDRGTRWSNAGFRLLGPTP